MKPPRFIGVFQSDFPGFGGPYPRHSHGGQVCDLFQAGAVCMSNRFIPVGVSGIDSDGRCWVLVHDYAIKTSDGYAALRWKVFDAEVAE